MRRYGQYGQTSHHGQRMSGPPPQMMRGPPPAGGGHPRMLGPPPVGAILGMPPSGIRPAQGIRGEAFEELNQGNSPQYSDVRQTYVWEFWSIHLSRWRNK
ncbi:hypothetical protein Tco_0401041 [Tanacetum coccineum]